jgi:hypothetical protein
MKLQSIIYPLLVLGASGVALTDTTHDPSGPYDLELHDEDIPTIQKNHGGWVNPEDLSPMPQCIAQQDQTRWLSAMTKCTRHRCTHHFIFCTHYQWLTELSCLSTEFSPSTISPYVEYCSRSVLAKAQLAAWIQRIAGRNWLVHVGDTNGLHDLSPRSLTQGYEIIGIEKKAPTCLRKAKSQFSEPFDHVLGSCAFTGTTLHQGNAARPWEYSTARKSMTALSFDTAGYDLISWYIFPGEYFDKECFCNNFLIDPQHEPCLGQLDLTKERLWLHAICGPSKLPEDWKNSLKILGIEYIPLLRWAKSSNIPDMPQSVGEFAEQCKTEACNTDPQGFCQVEPAIDRTCVCRKLDYSLCEGPCQNFESRTQYVLWLAKLCDNVEDWHGLPKDWHDILSPRPRDMIPWRWNLRPENEKDTKCPSYWAKIGSLAFVNLATALAVYFGERCCRNVKALEPHPKSPVWVLQGLVLASVQLLGHWIVFNIIQRTPGYDYISAVQIMLLLCSLPRLGWLVIAPKKIDRSESKDLTAACSALYAEVFLQIPNLYYMTVIVSYGLRHGFYFGVLPNTNLGYYTRLMYGGALLWVVVVALMVILIITVLRPILATSSSMNRTANNIWDCENDERTAMNNKAFSDDPLGERQRGGLPKMSNYGTMPVPAADKPYQSLREPHLSLSLFLSLGFLLLFLAQWLVWIGFVLVSDADYCPPLLDILTFVWTASSLATVTLKFTM